MDGLSSASDRAMFSEALTLYLYRHRLAQGPCAQLTNLIILEEAHHILARRSMDTKESVLETSIRMIRQYGIGYVFVDQSASLLSNVAFANSYATLALSQKLRADVQTMAGAMNLTEDQRDALSTLPIGAAVVRLADEHPEAFLVKLPRCPIEEGAVSDLDIQHRMAGYSGESAPNSASQVESPPVPPVPHSDKNKNQKASHPPSPGESHTIERTVDSNRNREPDPPEETMSREEIRFLADVASRPLSTTVSRYQRLHLSRRRGNAIRQALATGGHIESVPIATRSGQVVLNQLSDGGRSLCSSLGIDPGPRPRTGLEHTYWVMKAAEHLEREGYDVSREYAVNGNGTIDLLAQRPGQRAAVEIETGKSDVAGNLAKLRGKAFDRIVVIATSPVAVSVCEKAINEREPDSHVVVELLTWLDVS